MPNDLSASARYRRRSHETYAWGLAFFLTCVGGHAEAANLLDVYNRSIDTDPLWQQAASTRLAIRETKTQALLNLLPLDVSAHKNWASAGGTTIDSPAYAALAVGQPVLLGQLGGPESGGCIGVAPGEANYRAAAPSLIQRVTQQYFAVLAAQDVLGAQQSALRSVQGQLDQALKNYEGGLVSRTDVEAARASHDSNAAAVIAAKRVLSTQLNLLHAITNESYSSLAAPREDMPLLTPEPASEDAWVRTAMNQNAGLIANRLSAEIAHDNVLTAYGGHLPTIYVGATRNWALQHVDPNEPITLGIPLSTLLSPTTRPMSSGRSG